jgi:aryl-alcohol dehydrogenase-like predicted oxidoreductase
MKTRQLGQLEVSAIGLGCMSMTPIYGKPDPAEAEATIRRALEIGVTLIDTADAYNDGANETLVGRALAGPWRDRAILATKFGNVRFPDGRRGVDCRPEHVRASCEASLKRLGTDRIDLYFAHRIDPNVPIEDTVGEMARLKAEGKIRYLGLSEAAPATLRRAHATHPISALQTEYSLWTRDVEAELLGLCRDLGIGYVAYSPIGRGFLTGTINGVDDMEENDRRREHPRFAPDNLARNVALLAALRAGAAAEGCTPAQLALAWVLSRGPHVVPIPGTRRRRWLEENAAAVDLAPTAATLAALDGAFPPGAAAGTRYPVGQMKLMHV